MADTLLSIVQTINSYLSDYILFFMLIAVGLLYSLRTRFVQLRYFGEGMRRVFGNFTLRGKKQAEFKRSRNLAIAFAVVNSPMESKPVSGGSTILRPTR